VGKKETHNKLGHNTFLDKKKLMRKIERQLVCEFLL
jgi:hypothetical protein